MFVLGIESSCDETAAAVVANGREVLSNFIASQVDTHRRFGGVVPEIASREHLEKIDAVVVAALDQAGTTLDQIHGIAVTQGPGLIGSLLVGVNYAKGVALALGLPIVGVNHIEGHVYSTVFEYPAPEYPALALIVSGGHTNLFLLPGPEKYKLVGRTRDDAAGEAFDKVAKLLGLGYPGGPVIDRLARRGDKRAVIFPLAQINDPEHRLDFSFSGLKTAVLRYVREQAIAQVEDADDSPQQILDLCASFQNAVVRALVRSLRKACEIYSPRTIVLGGGVACNSELRAAVAELAEEQRVPAFIPSPVYTTDNAAMIAAAGTPKLLRGDNHGMQLMADVTLRLQNVDVEDPKLRKKVRYRL
ncbi:MAG: tRNA (adenosine(37)-N6)-threonylcarbamoyltransferase complex transferase subunit TsaD [Acidobacteria bacterium]|nr:tRNA (adenosine(37)-N6)-threonylcarbamoyltransferase complex transferase subunit TsaD [Acidobacteriota bacterium]MCW5967697.1 tRNA (adenosine(37)-N6)-threonylcarbamoyltransferase complex transferase subunit TsaD [Blastocatellales bacterium]